MVSWRQRIRILEARIEYLEKENEELRRRLLAYENPHTPPSKSKKKPPKKESNGKLGAPKGHPKWEREKPEPTGSVEYVEDTCSDCNVKLGKPFKTERILGEEVPEPQPIEVIEHLVNHYKCPKCKKHIIARNNAPKGRFGKNVLTHVTLLKFDDRLPLRKSVSSLERHYGLKITNVEVLKITNRVANKLAIPYKLFIKRIRRAKVVYVDETEIKVDGITYHLWTFVTETEAVFAIRKSRGNDVLKEILGENYEGVICCDGWRAYTTYSSNLQRCWAHLLREAKDFAKKYSSFVGFYEAIKSIFKKIKKLRKKPYSLKTRKKWKESLELEMKQVVEQMNGYKEFREFAGKIKNGLEHWFTCLIHLFVEPTNNNAERALRELIVQRKIIGGLRREKGARIMEIITSVIATLKKREQPLFQTMKSYL
jgi:transposase